MEYCCKLLVVLVILTAEVASIQLFSTDGAAGNIRLALTDDDSSLPIPLAPPFTILARERRSLHVSKNKILIACKRVNPVRQLYSFSMLDSLSILVSTCFTVGFCFNRWALMVWSPLKAYLRHISLNHFPFCSLLDLFSVHSGMTSIPAWVVIFTIIMSFIILRLCPKLLS